jgi:DNA-binding beta-propeller fold protein YncE
MTNTISTTIFFLIFYLTALLLPGAYTPALCSPDGFRYLQVKHVRDIVGDFNQPTEVAVAKSGRIYILDGANNTIKVFNSKGEMLFSFGKKGKKNGEFSQPVGMDIDNRENIYVADTGNQRIQIFDSGGSSIGMIDLASINARPVEVKYSPEYDRIYISDTNNHQILSYEKDGRLAFSWGSYGKMQGEFIYPGMADTDAAGNIYIVDILNGRMQIFNTTGENIGQIGKFGITPGRLFRPKGVVVDSQENVYVSDSYTGVVQSFDSAGQLVGILSEDKHAPLRLTTPLGMAMDNERNYLYVVQGQLNKISVFELQE